MGCGDRSVTFIEQYQITKQQARSCLRDPEMDRTSKHKPKENRDVDQWSHVDHVTTNAHSSQGESQFFHFEDNVAVVKMIIKGRSPTMRHVSRTHRVALDWLFDRINLQPKIQIKYVDTKPNSCGPEEILNLMTGPSSSFVTHHEFLNVLLQPFQQCSV